MIKCQHCSGYAYVKPFRTKWFCTNCGAPCFNKERTPSMQLANLYLGEISMLPIAKDMTYLHGRMLEAIARAEVAEDPHTQYTDIQDLAYTAKTELPSLTKADVAMAEAVTTRAVKRSKRRARK